MNVRALLAVGLVAPAVAVAAPMQLDHSGRALSSSGEALNGAHSVTVRLHTDPVASTNTFVDTFSGVSFQDGYYHVTLGANGGNPLLTSVFASDLYLGVSIDGAAELTPRTRLVSVPFAIQATSATTAASATSANALGAAASCGPSGAGEGWVKYDPVDHRVEVCNGTEWLAVLTATTNPASCKDIRTASPSATSGTYTIDVDGPAGPKAPFSAYCDMTPDGKGWTRIDVAYLTGQATLTQTGGTSSVASGEIRFFPNSRDTESWHDYDIGINFTSVRGQYSAVPHSHPDDNTDGTCNADLTYSSRLTTGSGNVSWQRFGVPGKVLKNCGVFGGEYTTTRTHTFSETTVPNGRVLRWSGGDETGDPGNELYGIRDLAIYVY